MAIDEGVAFILLAGDLYNGDWKDYNTGLFFARQMARLRDAGVQAFVVNGNHDAANQFTKSLRTPANVRRLSTSKAETVLVEEQGVAIHGRGFASKATLENLVDSYPDQIPGYFNIGMLHTSLDGREGHAPYSPCSLDSLRSKHYQYWALGHVHRREQVCADPWVIFPGNTQGRHIRETGPKGCTLVTVEDSEVMAVSERHLDVIRWNWCAIDVSGAMTKEAVLEWVARAVEQEVARADDRLLALRIDLRGQTPAHAACVAHLEQFENDIRALVVDGHGDSVWVEKIVLGTHLDRPEIRADNAAFARLLGAIATIDGHEESLVLELATEFTELRGKLPSELLTQGEEPIDPTSPTVLRDVIAQARETLLARLTSTEG